MRRSTLTRTTPLVNRAPMRRGDTPLRRSEMPKRAKRKRKTFITIGRFPYVRSERLLSLVRQLPCGITGLQGPNQAAHSNWSVHGKGRGIKASDIYIAALCPDVHAQIDQGSHLTAEQRQAMWWQAHVATVSALVGAALWPAGIPVPDIDTYPF